MAIIDVMGVRKTYRRGSESIAAVNDLSLEIETGEFVAVVGPSGSGKTTLLNLIGCVDTPDSGTVRIDGSDTTSLGEAELTKIRASKIGFIFQQFFLLPTLTAEENVLLPAMFARNRGANDRAAELLAKVGLGNRVHHRPKELSGGEMQRVAVARALINNPQILLADEPTGSLDSKSAEGIMEILTRLNDEGLTILMVTHNSQISGEADRVISLKDGSVVSA